MEPANRIRIGSSAAAVMELNFVRMQMVRIAAWKKAGKPRKR